MKKLILMAVAIAAQWAGGASAQQTFVDQGPLWNQTQRAGFYAQDQGSRLMPLKWLNALKQPNGGAAFMADNLGRYGYLKNDQTPGATLPVGFTTNTDSQGTVYAGMTCAACHTRQIEVGGAAYRIDGGPAIVDFQSFMADLHKAVQNVVLDQAAFNNFAAAVLGSGATQPQMLQLRSDVMLWFTPYDAIVRGSLPTPAWGPSRLDAVAMIFNRLTGLDIGPANDGSPDQGHMITKNIAVADAPTRYPFVWNAGIQNKTQWPGFAPNGDDLLAMVRNVGEVLGVFGHFYPTKNFGVPDHKDNSVNIDGLLALETYITKIGPPKYQWPVNQALAKQGEDIYKWTIAQGAGCEGCHGIKVIARPLGREMWDTPIVNVGTDVREWDTLGRTVNTGILKDTGIPFLKTTDSSVSVLASSVVGIMVRRLGDIAMYDLDHTKGPAGNENVASRIQRVPAELAEVKQEAAFKTSPGSYEARVMQGIWAAAPYLHNGSVPTLWDLLQPASERPKSFKIGPNYDPAGAVGLAVQQTKFDYTLQTADCSNLHSGNSNCGHEFGTKLTPDQKKALLEYLKTL